MKFCSPRLRDASGRCIGDDVFEDAKQLNVCKGTLRQICRAARNAVDKNRFEVLVLDDKCKVGWSSLGEELKQSVFNVVMHFVIINFLRHSR